MHTIKHATALTGVSADTLRMWERRYGVVAPVRTEGGYRLYDDAAIARLTAMRALVEAGWAPSRAAVQVTSGTTPGPMTPAPREDAQGLVSGRVYDSGEGSKERLDLLVRLAMSFDSRQLSHALDDAFARWEFEELVDDWLMPALGRLGLAWRAGTVSVAGEHFVSAGVHRRLATALDGASPRPGAPRVIVGLARGSRHELGVLAFGALLARAGFGVLYVGGDLPPDSWVVAVAGHSPSAVVLGVPVLDDVPAVRDTIAAIRAARPDVPLLLGGSHQELVSTGEPLGHHLFNAARALADRWDLARPAQTRSESRDA